MSTAIDSCRLKFEGEIRTSSLGAKEELGECAQGHLKSACGFSSDLGLYLDSVMSLQHHVNQLTAACFEFLRQIRSIRRRLPSQACTTLVTCLIFAWLNYCNTVFASRSRREINRLQSVQNAPVRLVTGARKYDHMTPLLLERHWLPIEQWVLFKLGVTMFKIVNDMAPSYLSQYAKPVSSLSSSSL